MLKRPRLKAHYVVEVVHSCEVFLLSEDRHFVVQGAAAVAVLPYLDGRHSVPDIAVALNDTLPMHAVVQAVRRFEAGGHLADGRPELTEPELAYWDGVGLDPTAAISATAAEVVLIAVGDVDAAPFADALAALGVPCRTGSPDGADAADSALGVAVVSDYLDIELAGVNKTFVDCGRPWLMVKPNGAVLWMGPLIRPGETGCWECLRQRLAGNRQIERYVQRNRNDDSPFQTSRGALDLTTRTAADLLAPEIVEVLATGTSPRLDATLRTLDRRSLTIAEHALVRQPQCPACGEPSLIAERDPRVTLQPLDARAVADAGYRTATPRQTYERLSKHVSPYLGAVTSLVSLTETDDGIAFSYGSSHNFPLGVNHLELLRKNVRGQSGGKGRTDTQARVSATAEAIERYSGVWEGNEPVTRDGYDELGPERAVHPHLLLNFSAGQYEDRADWNAHADLLQTVPDPFHDGCPIDWTTAWSLTSQSPRLVPAAHVWFGHPDLKEHFFTICDANGNAAGNTVEEAVLQGLCELIERDCVALWWYNRVRRPELDIDSLDNGYLELVRRFHADIDRRLWLLDITSDLGVPAIAAVSYRLGGAADDIVVGFGAHVDVGVAAMRAVTEVNQFLPFISERDATGDTVYPDREDAIVEWLRNARIDEEPWLLPDPTVPPVRAQDHPRPAEARLDEVIGRIVRVVERRGMEVLVVDQTRPELELNVVKVIVPGLRHFWRRLGPGRLFDVPVERGWLAAPVAEADLNPRSVFF